MMDDFTLLNQYVLHRSQDAFSQVVRQYAGLVYSSARRQLSDAHLAEDVTQAVFVTLAKKAASLPPGVVLSSWLLTATRYAASNARVVEARRKRHESTAAAIAGRLAAQQISHPDHDAWEDVAPALDEALAELPGPTRDALVLRYFGEKTLAEVAAALRITEDAAKQRVSRAVRQLRAALGARGVSVSPTALAGTLAAHAIGSAPPTLLKTTIAAAAAGGAGNWLNRLSVAAKTATGRVVTGAVAAAVVVSVVGAVIALAMRAQDSPAPSGGIVYTVAGTDRVSVIKDQTYLKVGRNAFWFDVYRPEGRAPTNGWPVVVLVHGGPVPLTAHPKDWPAYRAYGRVLGASGVAAVTFNYRFATEGDLPAAAADVAALLEFLRSHADLYGIDPDRVCLWAFSGGGPQLAAAVRDRPRSVRCLVSFYAPLDTGPGEEAYSPRAKLAALPPSQHIAPMLVARMGNDDPLINQRVDAFLADAKRRGEPVEVVQYPRGVHAFDIEQDTGESRDVIAKAVAFVKKHLTAGEEPK